MTTLNRGRTRLFFAVVVVIIASAQLGATPLPRSASALGPFSITAAPITAGATATYTISGFVGNVPSGCFSSVVILFPPEFNVAGATLVSETNLGSGALTVSGSSVSFSPLCWTANTEATLKIGNIVNGPLPATSYSLQVEVFNPQGAVYYLTQLPISGSSGLGLAFMAHPADTTASATMTPVQVAVQDSSGNTVTSAANPITLVLGSNSAGGTLSGTLTENAVNGVATFNDLSIDKAGTYILVATATGLTSASSNSFTINLIATTTTISSLSPNPSTYGSTLTFTARVTPASGTIPNGETVTFNDGSNSIGTRSIASGGIATFTTASLSVGPHYITASYSGDSSFAMSASSSLTQTVNQAASALLPNVGYFQTSTTVIANLNGVMANDNLKAPDYGESFNSAANGPLLNQPGYLSSMDKHFLFCTVATFCNIDGNPSDGQSNKAEGLQNAITVSQQNGFNTVLYDNEPDNTNLSTPPSEFDTGSSTPYSSANVGTTAAASTSQAATSVKAAGLKFGMAPAQCFYDYKAPCYVKQPDGTTKAQYYPSEILALTPTQWQQIDTWHMQTGQCDTAAGAGHSLTPDDTMRTCLEGLVSSYASLAKSSITGNPNIKIYLSINEGNGPAFSTNGILHLLTDLKSNSAYQGLIDGFELHRYDDCSTNPSFSNALTALGYPTSFVICAPNAADSSNAGSASSITCFSYYQDGNYQTINAYQGVNSACPNPSNSSPVVSISLPDSGQGTGFSSSAAASYSTSNGNTIVQISGVTLPPGTTKSITVYSPGSTSVCVVDSPNPVQLQGLICGSVADTTQINCSVSGASAPSPYGGQYTCYITDANGNPISGGQYLTITGLSNTVLITGNGPIKIEFTTRTALTSSAQSSSDEQALTAYGQAINFTASVSVNAPATGTPTGTVSFYDGASLLGSSALDNSGHAILMSITNLAIGPHNITATYNSDGNYTSSTSTILSESVIDVTPPVVTGTPDRSPDGNGWYNHTMTTTWSGTDNEAGGTGIKSCDSPTLYSGPDGNSISVIGHCTDNAGNIGKGNFTFNFDATPPVITSSQQGQVFALNQKVVPLFNCVDATSGVVPGNCGTPITSLDTTTPGSHSYTVTAIDNAGNKATLVVRFNVQYKFGGFLSPLVNGRSYSLSSTIPVQFQLFDSNGKLVTNAHPTIFVDNLNTPGKSSGGSNIGNNFRYDTTSNQYVFNLKPSLMGLAKGSHTVLVKLDDGTIHGLMVMLV